MDFDRAWRDSELMSNELIGFSGHQEAKDLAFPACQKIKKLCCGLTFRQVVACLKVFLQGPPDADQQVLIIKGLFHEIKGSRSHGANRQGDVAMSGYHD